MRNHTTPHIHELLSTAGKTPPLTPGSSVQTAQFLLNAIPNGVPGKFWYYTMCINLELQVTVDQPAMGGTAIDPDKLWKIIQSIQLQTPILGTIYTHNNTRGAVLGNIIQRLGYGFGAEHLRAQIAAADGDTLVIQNYRIPLSFECFRKPHETAPWGGFLEGGTFEVKLDVSTVLGSDSTGAVTKAPCQVRAWLEMIPSPEPVLHVPFNFREHILPGSTNKHIIQDMGSPDGLQGTDQQLGAGIVALDYLTDATGIGLLGADGADNFLGFDMPWRNQERVDVPQALFSTHTSMVGIRTANKNTASTHDGAGYPYTLAATPNGLLNDVQALIVPFVSPGRDLETTKIQTVYGAKEINVQYTAIPSGAARFLGFYLYTWESNFAMSLAARILPGPQKYSLRPKTLNKQGGMRYGDGKGAYVRLKVSPAG